MNIQFLLSFIPSVIGVILSYLSWNNSLTLGAEIVFILLCVLLLLLPFVTYKYLTLKYRQIPPIYHLKAECALSKEYRKILSKLSTSESTTATARKLSKIMLESLTDRLGHNYGAKPEYTHLISYINQAITNENDSVDYAIDILRKTGEDVDSILYEKQVDAGIQDILYPGGRNS